MELSELSITRSNCCDSVSFVPEPKPWSKQHSGCADLGKAGVAVSREHAHSSGARGLGENCSRGTTTNQGACFEISRFVTRLSQYARDTLDLTLLKVPLQMGWSGMNRPRTAATPNMMIATYEEIPESRPVRGLEKQSLDQPTGAKRRRPDDLVGRIGDSRCRLLGELRPTWATATAVGECRPRSPR